MRRLLVVVLLLAMVVGLGPATLAQPAPAEPVPIEEEDLGREAGVGPRQEQLQGPAVPRDLSQRRRPGGGTELVDPPVEENVDLPGGLIPYHEIAGRLRDLQARSDRVQVEVIGQSLQGRDLYLVTVADWTRGDQARNRLLRDLMIRDPARAQRLASQFRDFKVPVFVNGSIHGNEWEGTDAVLDLIERLAFDDDEATRRILDNTVVQFNVVANPDGRVLGTRRNGQDFDLNRDFITQSQPETRAAVAQLVEHKPMILLDLHGYVNPTLIEPATPPHNPNYEYDLYIRWAFPQAEAMAAAVTDATGFEPVIPYRDFDPGDWDDWPPIFTPMYAMYHGTYGHTLESPLRINGPALDLPPEERAERAAVNREVLSSATWAALAFAAENRLEMTLDQIEVFRRGAAGEPQPAIPFEGEYGPEDEYLADFPRAYVIPAAGDGTSPVAVARLVNLLLVNGVQVGQVPRAFSVDGTTYPAGSYVVDMAQPRRGLANTVLEPGYDISDQVPQMYDISGWSHALLWGAGAQRIDVPLPRGVRARPVREAVARGEVGRGRAEFYALELDDPVAVRAVNHLLDLGVTLERDADGRVLIPASARAEVRKLAEVEGLSFAALAAAPPERTPLEAPRIAAAIAGDEYFVLRELGFDIERVSTGSLAGVDLSAFDVLMVSADLSYANLDEGAKAAVQVFLDGGGGVVTRGATGARFNEEAGVLPARAVRGPGSANGIVDVVHTPGSPVVTAYPETDTSFVYSPLWFTDLGDGVQVDQRLAAGDFFVAGHWIGQEEAAGQPVIVSGETGSGARAVLFGTEPLFRDHPKKLYPQVAGALYWTGSG